MRQNQIRRGCGQSALRSQCFAYQCRHDCSSGFRARFWRCFGVCSQVAMQSANVLRPSAVPAGQPRWPAVVASIAVGLLFYAVPANGIVGPQWLPLALVSTLMIGAQLMRRARRARVELTSCLIRSRRYYRWPRLFTRITGRAAAGSQRISAGTAPGSRCSLGQ